MKKMALLILIVATCTQALAEEVSGPETAMLKYADAAKSFDAERITQLMHPEALQKFRVAFNDAMDGENGTRAQAELLPLFAVSTFEAYKDLSNEEAFKRLNETVSRGSSELTAAMGDSEYEIIGRVQEGEEVVLAYALTVTIKGQRLRQEVVQRLKQHNGVWLLLLPTSADASLAGLEARY